MKKRLAVLILSLILVMTAFAGCGSSGDAEAYVKGLMDIAYNKGTEAYVKAAGVKKEEAEKYMEQSVEAEAKIVAAYFGIGNPSEEVTAEFKKFVEKMYEGLDYEVKSDGDKVIVTFTQTGITLGEEAQSYIDEFNIKEFVDGDVSCTDEAFAKGIVELLCKELEGDGSAAETKEVEITVTEKDGKYTVSDEDLLKLDTELVVYQ